MTTAVRAVRRGAGAWLVPVLDALLEGAWIAVVDAAFAATSGTHPLGPLPFALLALASLVWLRSSPDRTTTYIGLGVLYVVAVVGAGLLGGIPPITPGAEDSSGFLAAIGQSSALLGALAVFRGSRHQDRDDDLVVGTVLQIGLPLLTLPWLYGTFLTPSPRATFVATAFPATLLFVTAGLFAAGLSRLDSLTASSGLDWRRNRPWLVLLVGILAIMTLIAVPASFVLGTPITTVITVILGPLAVVLSPVADVLRRFLEFAFGFLDPLGAFLRSLMKARPRDGLAPEGFGWAPPIPPDQAAEMNTLGTILISLGLLAAALIVLAILVRLTFRRPALQSAALDQPFEEREYRVPGLSVHLPRFRRRPRRADPTTASEAYLAFLGLLEQRPDLARDPAEPPATHAARLRAAGFTDRRAGLLAADYALERYALRELPPRETKRALRRWQGLRQALRG